MFSARSLRPLQWSQILKPDCQCHWTASRQFVTSRPASTLAALVSRPESQHQIYQSLSTNPFVNLAIENFLYERSPPDSKVLFLYINRPCVVIGRNQNPWLETNLRLLRAQTSHDQYDEPEETHFVRRRSGGGAVFHDEGNLNFSVICPKTIFHRDTHAEMVVRALKTTGAVNTRVNERHDIVLGQDPLEEPSSEVVKAGPSAQDAESPPLEIPIRAVKVSGSAYKLSRFRALHHGTCLVDSPNLDQIGQFLKSPARPYIKARGVESVRSPVGNISSAVEGFVRPFVMQQVIENIMEEFALMYNVDRHALRKAQRAGMNDPEVSAGGNWTTGILTQEDALMEDDVHEGYSELLSPEWRYNQCPQFTFSTHPTEEDLRSRPKLPARISPSARAFLRVKSGRIIESHISLSSDSAVAQIEATRVHEILHNQCLHEIYDWAPLLRSALETADQDAVYPEAAGQEYSDSEISGLARWLNEKLCH